ALGRDNLALCFQVDSSFSQSSEQVVCLALFVERLLENLRLVFEPELTRIGTHGSVTGHLIVLDVLCRGNQAGIEDVRLRLLLDQVAALLYQSFHAHAFLAAGTDTQLLADHLEALRVLPGLAEVRLES